MRTKKAEKDVEKGWKIAWIQNRNEKYDECWNMHKNTMTIKNKDEKYNRKTN